MVKFLYQLDHDSNYWPSTSLISFPFNAVLNGSSQNSFKILCYNAIYPPPIYPQPLN